MPTVEKIDKAKQALANFNKIAPSLNGFASALAGYPVTVKAGTNTYSDGNVITIRPTIALADEPEHIRSKCDKRDGITTKILCPACANREHIVSMFFHEISHITFGSFAEFPKQDFIWTALDNVEVQTNKDRAANNLRNYNSLRRYADDQPVSTKLIADALNKYFPTLVNAIEDARVDAKMVAARPGTSDMQAADFYDLSINGLDTEEGLKFFSQLDLNGQLVIAVLSKAKGYSYPPNLDPYILQSLRSAVIEELFTEATRSRTVMDSFRVTWKMLVALQRLGFFIYDEQHKYIDDEPEPEPEEEPEEPDDEPEDEPLEKEHTDQTGDNDNKESDESGEDEGDNPSETGDPEESEDEDAPSNHGDEETDKEAEEGEEGEEEPSDADGDTEPDEDGEPEEADGGDGEPEEEDAENGGEGEAGDGTPGDSEPGKGSAGSDFSDGEIAGEEMEPQVARPDDSDFGDDPSQAQEMLDAVAGHDEIHEDDGTNNADLMADMTESMEHFDDFSQNITGIKFMEAHDFKYQEFIVPVEDRKIPESIIAPSLLHMRRVFTDNAIAERQGNRRSGRVNQRVLGRRAWGDDDRLFTKKSLPGKRDYAVLIGIDASGSTAGYGRVRGDIPTIQLEIKAAYAQAELCARMGIKFSIFAHTGGQSKLHIYRIKEWDQPWNTATKDRLWATTPSRANIDGHTLEFYRKEMEKVRATDKIIMYYSDGEMPLENYHEELRILQREIQTCKKKGIILMGVGARTDSPTKHGLITVRVDGMKDIQNVVKHLGKQIEMN